MKTKHYSDKVNYKFWLVAFAVLIVCMLFLETASAQDDAPEPTAEVIAEVTAAPPDQVIINVEQPPAAPIEPSVPQSSYDRLVTLLGIVLTFGVAGLVALGFSLKDSVPVRVALELAKIIVPLTPSLEDDKLVTTLDRQINPPDVTIQADTVNVSENPPINPVRPEVNS